MKEKKFEPPDAFSGDYLETFRRKAYKRLHEFETDPKIREALDMEMRSVLHELQVHQIELELQNEELKRSQEELVLQRESYYHLFHMAPVGYALLDENGIIRKSNQMLCQMMSFSQCEEMNEPLLNHIIEEDRTVFASRFKAFFKKPEGKLLEIGIMSKKGELLHMEMRGRKETKEYFGFSGIDSDASMILITFNDVTERKKAEQTVVKAMVAAEEASSMKSRFLANMSHELRTPLTSIIGFSEAMERGEAGKVNPEQKHFLKYIEKSGHHLLKLINELLDISKIESGKMELHPEYIELDDVFEEVKNIVYPMASFKSIELTFEIEPTGIVLEADSSKLRQILLNLLSNAVKFTPENGSVSVSARDSGNNVKITVADTGIGIPENCHNKIFEPFEQVSFSGSNQSSEGTGLGLALVKSFVELHGGHINVESEPEKGSKFSFCIPGKRNANN
ncbi:MAG: PAS domain-containing sensor histidine kinase [Methanolobus sp.]